MVAPMSPVSSLTRTPLRYLLVTMRILIVGGSPVVATAPSDPFRRAWRTFVNARTTRSSMTVRAAAACPSLSSQQVLGSG